MEKDLEELIEEEVLRVLSEKNDGKPDMFEAYDLPKVHSPMLIGAEDYHDFDYFKRFLNFLTPEDWDYHELTGVKKHMDINISYPYITVFMTEKHLERIQYRSNKLDYADWNKLFVDAMDLRSVYSSVWSEVLTL